MDLAGASWSFSAWVSAPWGRQSQTADPTASSTPSGGGGGCGSPASLPLTEGPHAASEMDALLGGPRTGPPSTVPQGPQLPGPE